HIALSWVTGWQNDGDRNKLTLTFAAAPGRMLGPAPLWCQVMELMMRRIIPGVVLVVGLIAPASAQKAEIEAVNAKWIEFFNKGDFAGIASLYTADATAFPPGSAMVKGKSV